MKKTWFATVKDSHLDSEESRADFIARHVEGATSLVEVISALRPEQFDLLLTTAHDEITHRNKEAASQAKLEEPKGWHKSVTPRDGISLVSLIRHSGLTREKVYPFIWLRQVISGWVGLWDE